METKSRNEKDDRTPRRRVQRRPRPHDPMLILNLEIFNFTGGWKRTFSKNEYARAYA